MKIFFLTRKKENSRSETYNKSVVVYLCKGLKFLKMKYFLPIMLFFCSAVGSAQPKLELTPQGFQSQEMQTPDRTLDQLLELSKAWASYYNKKGYDVFNITENSITIEARNINAFYSFNIGVKYNYDIVYTLKIVFEPNRKYTLNLAVKEIYAENVLMKTTLADFFTPDGKLKDDYRDAKPSLENTANNIVKSFANFISR